MLVDQLRAQDKVSIVVYAGAAGLVLSPTSGSEKTKIKDAIDKLESGGSTAGGAGIKLAYKTAKEHYVKMVTTVLFFVLMEISMLVKAVMMQW